MSVCLSVCFLCVSVCLSLPPRAPGMGAGARGSCAVDSGVCGVEASFCGELCWSCPFPPFAEQLALGVNPSSAWPLQDILSLLGFCARINHPFIAPPTCIAHTVAIRLRCYCAIFAPLPTPHFHAIRIQYCALQYGVKAKALRPTGGVDAAQQIGLEGFNPLTLTLVQV